FFQAEDGIRDFHVTGVQTCALPIFPVVRELAHAVPGGAYALGIHPICVPNASPDDLNALEREVEAALGDPRFVGIGEIGLDFFRSEERRGGKEWWDRRC